MFRRPLTLAFLLIVNIGWAQNTNLGWAGQVGGSDLQYGNAIAVDLKGNSYFTGYFTDTTDFNPGSGITNLADNGFNDVFILKLDSLGSLVWAKQVGGNVSDQGFDIAVDQQGNVYTTGFYTFTTDFDPGPGVASVSGNNVRDAFILKLDSNGNYVWANGFGSTGHDIGFGITTDIFGNVLSTGYFSRSVDFDPGSGVLNLRSNGVNDIFIQKLDTNGNLIWVKQIGGYLYNSGHDLITDRHGNVYTTGYFGYTADFDPGSGVNNIVSNGDRDAFIVKLNPNGNFMWVTQLGGPSEDFANAIALDLSGNVVIAGNFKGTADFDPGSGVYNLTSSGHSDVFVQKLDSNGHFLWARHMGGIYSDEATSVATDRYGNVYVSGHFMQTVDFDPGPGTSSLTSHGDEDMFIEKLDADGNFRWVKHIGGSHDDQASSIALDTALNLYATGYFNQTLDIDPGPGNTTFTSQGFEDMFVMRLEQCVQMSRKTAMVCDSLNWIDGNTYTQTTDIPSYTFILANGCDSAVSLDLTIPELDTTTALTSVLKALTISSNDTNATSYQWLDCDAGFRPVSGETSADFTVPSNGRYAVQITKDGCTDTSACVEISNFDITEPYFSGQVRTYPNPTDGKLTIETSHVTTNLSLELYSPDGRLLDRKEDIGNAQIYYELKGPPGLYFLKFTTDKEGSIQFKVIKSY